MKSIKYCPICGSVLKFDGFCEEDGHYHYFCETCEHECTERCASDTSILDMKMEDVIFEE